MVRWLLLLSLFILLAAPSASACGEKRWAVKTLTDPAVREVHWSPKATTIGHLVSLQRPAHPAARSEQEMHVYRLRVLVEAVKVEEDGDVHLVLSDGVRHMIAESPSLLCTKGAQHRWAMSRARRSIERLLHPSSSWSSPRIKLQLSGVLFFDFRHGQRGLAPNGVELHPLLSVRQWR